MKNEAVIFILGVALSASSTFAQARNVILFFGDGAGVSSLNAASIYGYGKPQALYVQKMPYLALSDTSSAREWVTDGAASATAVATGVKTRNGVVAQSASAERDIKDGENLETILEYAEERGLSTGVISNDDRSGVTLALVSAFYAHSNNRQRFGDIFLQLLNPKYGDGPDVVIGTGRKAILQQTAGHNLDTEIAAKGYAYVDSLDKVSKLQDKNRLIALFDDPEFDLNEAVRQATARLSRNPKGFFLVVFSDCHLPNTRKTLSRIIELDKVIQTAAEANKKDTLVLLTADHSYDLRIKGEDLTETAKSTDHKRIALAVSLESEHTAEEVPVLAVGPGAERVHGFISNTDVFHIMMYALGWETYRVQARYPIAGEEGWDYITADSLARRLYVSHGVKVEVLDADTGNPVGLIPDTPGVHGIAIDSVAKHGFTSNGKEDKVSMFDTKTLRVIRKIDVGKGPDGIFFDSSSGHVFTCNHGSHDITAIDGTSGQVVGTVKADGDCEQMVTGRGGRLAFDTKTKKIFLPAADVEVIPGADASQRPQRKVKPGSFGVLVVSR